MKLSQEDEMTEVCLSTPKMNSHRLSIKLEHVITTFCKEKQNFEEVTGNSVAEVEDQLASIFRLNVAKDTET